MTLTTPQVKVKYRYEVDGTQIHASSVPSINMTSDSELKITFRGSFYDYRAVGVDFLSDELHVIVSINGDEYNLGYYIITSEKLSADDGVTTIEVEGYSRLYLLKQSKIEARVYFAAGTLYTDAIYALLTDAGISNYNLIPSTLTLATAREDWEVGTDRLTIINALLSEMSYSSAYVDHDGKIQLTPTVEATPASVGITYLADRYSIIGADYTMSADRHGKPNVFMVMCSNPELTAPLTSVIENSSEDNPYSTAYRPRVLSVTKVDNIASQTALDNFAFNLMAKSLLSDETVTFETMLNPEHTVNDVLALGNGDLSGVFLETGWTMTLDANASMTHTARRTVGYLSAGPEPVTPPSGPYDIILAASAYHTYTGTATRSAMGATLTDSFKWHGGVLSSDGKIYTIPYEATNILIIDPATGAATRSAMGASLSGSEKWAGGVLGPDGKIYAIPYGAADILIINPAAGTATRSTMGASLSENAKWVGGVLGSDGKIYAIPHGTTADILIIDPVAGIATRSTMGADLSGSGKWRGGVLGPDGKIYAIPYGATDILIIDPAAGMATRSTMGADLSSTAKWAGGVLGSDGKIYAIPYGAADILIINPAAGTATRSTMGATLTNTIKWYGGALGPDGKIYAIPHIANDILIIDPTASTATRSAMGATLTDSYKWYGGVLSSNGKIYAIPVNATDILIIDKNSAVPAFDLSVCTSAYLNKF